LREEQNDWIHRWSSDWTQLVRPWSWMGLAQVYFL
jgi:hypothetical protein